ncbi:MAG: pyrroline-5-carboxylate reductase [Paludibacteraceae bacterium]|nr:pyrroline-5-carboxylate reductase [Paludibacteraceae bacterium]
MTNVTLIGAGNMGGALAHGWLKSEQVKLTVADKDEKILQQFSEQYASVVVTTDNRQAVKNADIVVLVVKPWLMDKVLDEIRPELDLDCQIVVSDAANYGTDKLSSKLGGAGQYFYVIPNIGAEYGASMSFVSHNGQATAANIDKVIRLYSLCGEVMEVQENQVEAGMMMASCGIAYVMRMVRAMTEGGVEMGFYPVQAQKIAMQTMQGAVTLLNESGLHPEVAIDKVTTPGGVTIKGLNELDRAGFNAAVVRCLKAGMK